MVDKITISNYKSILSQRFTLGRLNVFYGAKGSGKTNILEAIGMAAAAHDDTLDAASLIERGINPIRVEGGKGEGESFRPFDPSSFRPIEIVWHEKNSWKKCKLVCEDITALDPVWKDVSWHEPEYIEKINKLIEYISNGSIEGVYPYEDESKNVALNAAFRGSRNLRNYRILRHGDFETARLLDAETEETRLLDDESLCLESCVLGSSSLLSNIAIFAIDDIEKVFSPDKCKDKMRTFFDFVMKHNKQAFITTSSPVFAEAVDIKNHKIKLFTVKMNDKGQTEITMNK